MYTRFNKYFLQSPEPILGGGPAVPGPAEPGPAEPNVSWRDSLSEDIRNDPSLKLFDGVEGLAKSHINAQKLIGQKGIIKPTNESSSQEWDSFYSNFRDPDIEKYELEKGESGIDDDFFKEFKGKAHEMGLSVDQANGIFKHQEEMVMKSQEKLQERMLEDEKTAISELTKEWGNDFQSRIGVANKAMEDIGKVAGIDMVEHLGKLGMQNDTTLIKFLYQVGKSILEDSSIPGMGDASLGTSVEDATIKYNSYMADTEGPYHNRNHADHNRVVKDMEKLISIMSSVKS